MMFVSLVSLCFARPADDFITRPDILPSWVSESGDVANDGDWWTSFGDPALAQIVDRAIRSNSDLAAASARTDATRAQGRTAWASLLPSITFDANGTISPTATRGFQFGGLPSAPGAPEPPKTFTTGQAAFNGNWEVDLFLRNQQTLSASRFDTLAAEGDRNAAVLAFTTRVVEGYFDVVAARQRAALVESQHASAQQLLELVELRYQAGDASSVDVLQQRQAAARIQAQVPVAKANAKSLAYSLAVALSLPPATVVPGVSETLPTLPPLPDAGVPADLILNRPDLVAADARIDASVSRHRATVRQLLPTLRLQGSAGWQFFNETEFLSQSFWSAGASVSVPLFSGGRRHHSIQGTRSQQIASAHSYTQLAANAVLEVENALLSESSRTEQLAAVEAQYEASRAALEEAREQYVRGIGNYLTLLTAQNTFQSAELTLLDTRRQLLSARIQLHDALGGDWMESRAQTLGDAR